MFLDLEEVSEVETLAIEASYSSQLQLSFRGKMSVSPRASYHTSHLRILLIFGQKLEDKILRLLTEPDYPKKIWIIQ